MLSLDSYALICGVTRIYVLHVFVVCHFLKRFFLVFPDVHKQHFLDVFFSDSHKIF